MTDATLAKLVRDPRSAEVHRPSEEATAMSVLRNLDRTLLRIRWQAGGECVVFPEELEESRDGHRSEFSMYFGAASKPSRRCPSDFPEQRPHEAQQRIEGESFNGLDQKLDELSHRSLTPTQLPRLSDDAFTSIDIDVPAGRAAELSRYESPHNAHYPRNRR